MADSPTTVVLGADGLARCPWPTEDPLYLAYHDDEWAVPVRGERALFERLTLEAFQSGLSWITVLRKRDAFRAAFADFNPQTVARFSLDDRARLMKDASIIRNRAKIDATIRNASAVLRVREGVNGGLDGLIWSFAPIPAPPAPVSLADVPSSTPESTALAKELKRRGFSFVGPTTAYAMMQACGLVNDHLLGCHARRDG
ncbi:MAG: DNA-3-methyladenine glycosylase I [Actinomycetales bacterium]